MLRRQLHDGHSECPREGWVTGPDSGVEVGMAIVVVLAVGAAGCSGGSASRAPVAAASPSRFSPPVSAMGPCAPKGLRVKQVALQGSAGGSFQTIVSVTVTARHRGVGELQVQYEGASGHAVGFPAEAQTPFELARGHAAYFRLEDTEPGDWGRQGCHPAKVRAVNISINRAHFSLPATGLRCTTRNARPTVDGNAAAPRRHRVHIAARVN